MSMNRHVKVQKRGQLFIRTYNEPPAVVAMCVRNEHRSSAEIHSGPDREHPSNVIYAKEIAATAWER